MTTAMDQRVPIRPNRPMLRRWMSMTVKWLAWLLVGGIVLQIFFIGSALLVDGSYLAWHKQLGSWLAYLPMGMLGAALVGRLQRKVTLRTLLVVVLYVLQFVFVFAMNDIGLQALRGLHAVNALALFLVSIELARLVSGETR